MTDYTQTYLGGRVPKTWNDENITYYSYNHKGELIFTVQDIDIQNANSIGMKTMNYSYDFFGRLSNKVYQKSQSEEFAHIYTYDRDGQLLRVETNNGAVVKHTEYEYYTHVALKSINHPFIGRLNPSDDTPYDPGTDGYSDDHSAFARDVFGMTIDYHEGDYSRANTNIQSGATDNDGSTNILPTEHYDGRIKSIRWNTQGPNDATGDAQNMFLYDYDWKGQLTQAVYGTYSDVHASQANSASKWTFHQIDKYKLHGLTYDDNGNIMSLKRNDKDGLLMDDLSYQYEVNTNKLNRVQDAVGFKNYDDVAAQIADNYQYNASGAIIIDREKSIQIDYHANGKVKYVKENNTGNINLPGNTKVSYTYNERGDRLTKSQHNPASGNVVKITYYVREISGAVVSIYEKDVAGSNTIEQTEVPVASIGMYYVQSDHYVYQITDHLGNVRATISDTKISGAAEVLSYADYYPFGMTMAGRNASSSPEYRLAYQGQELDKEIGGAGFYAFSLRHYDARLGKWLSPDPYEQHWSPYLAMSNNPVSFVDPDGGWDWRKEGWGGLFTPPDMSHHYIEHEDQRNSFDIYRDGFLIGSEGRAETLGKWYQVATGSWTTYCICNEGEMRSTITFTSSRLDYFYMHTNKPTQKYADHIVKAGDTPYDLAIKYNITVWDIARNNQGKEKGEESFFNDIQKNSNGDYSTYWEEGKGTEWMIYPGDVLRIPDNRPILEPSSSNKNKRSPKLSSLSYKNRYEMLVKMLYLINKDLGEEHYLDEYLNPEELPSMSNEHGRSCPPISWR